MKNRIAVIHNLPKGGAMRMMREIIKRYRNKCEIDIYSISTNKPWNISGTKSFWFRVFPWKGFFLYNFWVYFVLRNIHKKISREVNWSKYDLIFVTHDYFTKSPFILRNIKSKKIVYLCQEAQREFYESSKIHAPHLKDKIIKVLRFPIKWIDEHNIEFVSKIICNSRYSKKNLEKIYKKSCEIVYPGVDREIFKPKRIKKDNSIVCIGGICNVKGQEFLINSLRPLLNKYKLILVGKGIKKDIKHINKIIKNSNIKIVSWVNDETLINYYRKAKVTCIAAYKEPFGLSSIESQACGTPVVSVNEGGPRETILDGISGFLAEREDYYSKVKKCISKYRKMGKRGEKEIINKWTWNITLKPLDKYFLK